MPISLPDAQSLDRRSFLGVSSMLCLAPAAKKLGLTGHSHAQAAAAMNMGTGQTMVHGQKSPKDPVDSLSFGTPPPS